MKTKKNILFTSPLTPLLKGEGKKFLVLLLYAIIFLSLFNSDLQTQWVQVAQINTSELRDVKFFDQNTGIVCGVGGIWKSTNGGFNWNQVYSGNDMNSISFPDQNRGYVAGDNGKILQSTGRGSTWVLISIPDTNNWNSIFFRTFFAGHVVGELGKILITANGGQTWTSQYFSFTEDLNDIFFYNNGDNGYCVGTIQRELLSSTANGGINWLTTLANQNSIALKSVYAINQTNVICVGQMGRVRRSTNNGFSWTILNLGTTETFNDVNFVDVMTGYIVGNAGKIFKSTDSGYNWINDNSATSLNLKHSWFINTNTGWVVGQNGIVLNKGLPTGINHTGIPEDFEIVNVYPNPFNPEIKCQVKINKRSNIKIEILNIGGQLTELMFEGELNRGFYEFEWNPKSQASGVYFLRVSLSKNIITKKIIYMR